MPSAQRSSVPGWPLQAWQKGSKTTQIGFWFDLAKWLRQHPVDDSYAQATDTVHKAIQSSGLNLAGLCAGLWSLLSAPLVRGLCLALPLYAADSKAGTGTGTAAPAMPASY